jgi:hypothetical protein
VRENRMPRSTWRELQTWNGRDVVTLVNERARNRENKLRPKHARQFSTLLMREGRIESCSLPRAPRATWQNVSGYASETWTL